jgi:hypothetical protein
MRKSRIEVVGAALSADVDASTERSDCAKRIAACQRRYRRCVRVPHPELCLVLTAGCLGEALHAVPALPVRIRVK